MTKPVHQYDLEGNYINSYASVKEAAKAINATSPEITNACDLHYRAVRNYRFTSVKHTKLFKYSNNRGCLKQVYLYDVNGNLVKEFKTRKDAAKYFGISSYKLTKLLQLGVVDEYKISSIKVDKFVEFKSRRFISS